MSQRVYRSLSLVVLAAALASFTGTAFAEKRDVRRRTVKVVCESKGPQRTYCRGDATFGVQLTRQLSRTKCVFHRNWGSDRNGVWVSDGCRAEFALRTR